MDRPTVLLAIAGDPTQHLAALRAAGFDADAGAEADASSAHAPDLAVLDCDLPATRVSQLYEMLHRDAAVPTILLVGETTELPTGVGSGISHDEVALKPVPPEALVYRLQALLIRGGQHLPTESGGWADSESLSTAQVAGEGHVVSIFAPKGGVGKTTVAVNIAVALRLQTRAEVLLFDADAGVGNVTSVLDVPYRMGLADLADSKPEEWTDAAFEHTICVHPETGVRVLTWGTDPAESERVTADLLLAALRWGRNHHSYVIVDTHPGYDDRTMAMLTVSNEIFLVVTPEMGALRNSSQFLALARELGLASVVKVIVNRANHGIRTQDMATSLGMPIAATVVSNGPKAIIAMNEGRPLVTRYPKEQIATDLHNVARLISQPEAQPAESQGARRRWMRLGARTSEG
jgi:pilus assembly protein CpaE